MDKHEILQLVNTFCDEHQPFHSNYQIDNFIIRKNGVTPWGSYKQSVREIYSRRHSLGIELLELDKLQLNKAKYENIMSNCDPNSFEYKEAEIEVKQAILQIKHLEDHVRDKLRELTRMVNIALHFYSQIKDKNPDELEKDFWEKKFIKQAAVKGYTPTLIEHLYSLPTDSKKTVFDRIGTTEKLEKLREELENVEDELKFDEVLDDDKVLLESTLRLLSE